MLGKTHKIGGYTAGFIIIAAPYTLPNLDMNPITGMIPVMTGAVIGAFWPDIDDIRSTIGRKLWFISWIYFLIQFLFNKIIKKPKNKILKNMKRSINHRGFAHWPINYIIIFAILYIYCFNLKESYVFDLSKIKTLQMEAKLNWLISYLIYSVACNFILGFSFGALSHLLFDLYNYSGIDLFAPFYFKRISFGNVDTSNEKQELAFRRKAKLIMAFTLVVCVLSINQKYGIYNLKQIQNIPYYQSYSNKKRDFDNLFFLYRKLIFIN